MSVAYSRKKKIRKKGLHIPDNQRESWLLLGRLIRQGKLPRFTLMKVPFMIKGKIEHRVPMRGIYDDQTGRLRVAVGQYLIQWDTKRFHMMRGKHE